jgi:hypothetical protein
MKSLAPVLAGVLVALLAPASALANIRVSAHDRAATRAYLRATSAYERAAYADFGATVAAIEARADEIAGECPSALTDAPRDAVFQELGEEAGAGAFYAGMGPLRASILRLAQAIRHLTWGDHSLTRLVRVQAADEHAVATLGLPDLCVDIGAWKASAYATLPQSAASFLMHVRAIESVRSETPFEESTEVQIRRLLTPYERPSERRIAKRAERLERRLDKRLTAAANDARKKLAAALGVSAL